MLISAQCRLRVVGADRHPERSEGSPPTRSFAVFAAQDDVWIVAAWLAAIAIATPRGNFPRDDDWDFALATWRFARTGHFVFTPFTAVSLRAQVLWGALWTRLFGESFDVLRLSTLVLAALTLVVVHRTLAHLGAGRFARVIGTLALGFHPFFAWSACTYMTEVPFVFASAVALYFFVREMPVAGSAAIVVSWFVRQTGVAWALAALAAARNRRWAAAALSTIALFVALLIFKIEWLSGAPAEFGVHFRMWRESSFRLPQQLSIAYHWFDFNARNSGLFFLPLVAPLIFVLRRRWIPFAVVAVVLFVRAQSLINAGLPMPYFVTPFCCDVFGGNVLADFGLGPVTLKGTYPVRLAMGVRLLLTYGSVVAGALLVGGGTPPGQPPGRRRAQLFVLFGTLALLGSGLYVDRYALDSAWALAVALPLVVPWERRAARIVACVALAALAIFDVCAIHDDFAWNRARWAAFEGLRARGVAVGDIDAGAEPWYLHEIANADRRTRRLFQFGIPPRKYVVAFAPLRGYTVIETMPFRSWLGLREEKLYMLRRAAVSAAGPAASSPPDAGRVP